MPPSSSSSSSSSSSPRSLSSRVRLYVFVVLLACVTSAAIVCFSLAVVDDVFVYAGIVCVVSDVILIAAHSLYRRCSSPSSPRGSRGRGRRRPRGAQGSVPAGAPNRAGHHPPRDLRAIESDVRDLMDVVIRVQAEEGEGEGPGVLVQRLRDDVETESGRLALWIEGRKVPERSEVEDMVERLDDIRIQLRSIRRRNERMASSFDVDAPPFVSTLSYNDRFLFPLPPPYEDLQRHLPNEQPTNSSFALSTSALPSYSSCPSFPLAPSSATPVDDCAPPPPYEEASGAPH